MIGCCCGEGNSKIYQSFILRRSNQFYHFLRPGQGQAVRRRTVLPAKLSPAARKSKNISLSNLVIFSTIQILTSPRIASSCCFYFSQLNCNTEVYYSLLFFEFYSSDMFSSSRSTVGLCVNCLQFSTIPRFLLFFVTHLL